MKRYIYLIFCICSLALGSCGGSQEQNESTEQEAQPQAPKPWESPDALYGVDLKSSTPDDAIKAFQMKGIYIDDSKPYTLGAPHIVWGIANKHSKIDFMGFSEWVQIGSFYYSNELNPLYLYFHADVCGIGYEVPQGQIPSLINKMELRYGEGNKWVLAGSTNSRYVRSWFWHTNDYGVMLLIGNFSRAVSVNLWFGPDQVIIDDASNKVAELTNLFNS